MGQLDRWSPWSSLAFIGLLWLDSEQPMVEREVSMGHSHPRSGRGVLCEGACVLLLWCGAGWYVAHYPPTSAFCAPGYWLLRLPLHSPGG